MISFCFLLFTLLSTINVVNFHLSVFFYILKMILTWILALNFSKMVLKWNFFTWTMSILSKIFEKPLMNIIQNIWETLDFFLHLFQRNSKTSQKSIVFSFFYHFVTQILVQKAHTFSFFVFSWICHEQSLIKPIEIAVFVLKVTYFGYENGQLWTMPISNLEMFFKILVNILTNFRKLFSFMKNH